MIGTQITISNKRTGRSFVINDYSDDDNIIALQSFPSDNIDIRTNDIQNSGRHGSHKLPYYYGGRSIILDGIIAATSEADVWLLKSKIDDVLQFASIPDFNETLTLTYLDPNGISRSIDCTLSSNTKYDRRMKESFKLVFQITLRSNKYYYLTNEDNLLIDGKLGYLFGGFSLKTLVPFKLQSSYSEVKKVTVSGNYFSKLTLYGSDDGPVINPRFKNDSTGDDIIFFYTLNGADEYIEIDGINGTIKNQDGQDLTVYLVSGDFLTLQDGENRLAYISTLGEGTPPEAVFSIEAKRYIV